MLIYLGMDDRTKDIEKIASKIIRKKPLNRREILKKSLTIFIPLIFLLVVGGLSLLLGLLDISQIKISNSNGDSFNYLDINKINSSVEEKVIGIKLPQLSIADTKSLVVESSPFVKSVYIEKVFPDKVDIRIEERVPFLIVKTTELCAVLDPDNVVVELSEVPEGSEESDSETSDPFFDCEEIESKYHLTTLFSKEIKADFVLGEESTFYDAEKILVMKRSIESQKYEIKKITLEDSLYIVTVEPNRSLIFSAQQSIDLQLKRFLLVAEQIEQDQIDFLSLDLRYERPVLVGQ